MKWNMKQIIDEDNKCSGGGREPRRAEQHKLLPKKMYTEKVNNCVIYYRFAQSKLPVVSKQATMPD